MRTHGWSGSAPASDEEAVERILTAARNAIANMQLDDVMADTDDVIDDEGLA